MEKNTAFLTIFIVFKAASAESQYFAVRPADVSVSEGETALLKCEVADQGGAAQWTKDGLLLGFDRGIPGFERYYLEGEESQGIHNLVIQNVSLEDEGEYECQVGPATDHPAISAKAQLTILLPAKNIEIEDYSNNSKVTMGLSESVQLKCIVKGGKPAPQIRWYRSSVKLRDDVAESSVSDDEGGRQTATSTLTLHPLPHDNGVWYTCEAQRLNVEGETRTYFKTLTTRVKLDVRFPPGRPSVEGYREGETVRMGDTLNLRCVSRGGNPLAHVAWFKDGKVIDQSYISTDWESINELSHVADPSDNGALYTCRASSSEMTEPYEASISMRVLYAPSKVTIDYPTEAKSGDVITLTCTTAKSNPASEISWVVDGRPISSPNVVTEEDKGGWTTKTEITVNITQQEKNMKLVSCYAINQALGETVVGAATISILYAPDPPAIFGYTEGTSIRAGTLQRLTCVSHGGNPLPTMKWFKGDNEVSEMQTTTNGNVVSGEITVVAADNDNGAMYRCETSSAATPDPLTASIILVVYFPPSSVTIKTKPKKPKVDQKVSLICESSSSHPAANVTWWRDGQLLPSTSGSKSSSTHGGFTTKRTLTFNASSEDDGASFTCKATNEAVQHSVHDAITLRVLYKPVFPVEDPVTAEVKEEESFIMNMSAMANPDKIDYIWMKDNETLQESAVLNITEARKEDAGKYVCQATNDVGYSQITLILKVLYAATVVMEENVEEDSGTFYVVAEAESNPQLNCTAIGYPLPDDVIKWKRDSFDMESRTKTSSSIVKGADPERRRSQLTIYNVTKEDSGDFECVVNNGVGDSSCRKFTLLVKHPPVVIKTDDDSVIKSDRGVNAEFHCKAEGVPQVHFTWYFEGGVLKTNDRISHSEERIDHVTWESKLTMKEVSTKDFGEYKCVARNEVGFDTIVVTLEANSAPDPPLAVRVINVTHEAVQLSWVPGFDGGHNQSYKARFRLQDSAWATYIDIHPPYATSTWLRGLQPNATYEFAVMALNEVGRSSYSSDKVKAQTLDSPRGKFRGNHGSPETSLLNEDLLRLLLSSASVVLLLFLIMNAILLFFYYNRRKKKKERKKDLSSYTFSETASNISSETFEGTPSVQSSEEMTLSDYSDPFTQVTSTLESETTPNITLSNSSTQPTESESKSLGRGSYNESTDESDFIEGMPYTRPGRSIGSLV